MHYLLPVAYAENFHGDFIQWRTVSFVLGVRSLRRHNLTSYSCFPNKRFGEVCADQS